MAVIDDFVVESCTASGTTITLTGRWSGGCRTFAESNVGNGNPCRAKIEYIDPATGKPEGEGATVIATYSSGGTLSITTWLKTRSGSTPEPWVAGRIYRVYLTADSAYLEEKVGGASALTTVGQVPYVTSAGALGALPVVHYAAGGTLNVGSSWTSGTGTLSVKNNTASTGTTRVTVLRGAADSYASELVTINGQLRMNGNQMIIAATAGVHPDTAISFWKDQTPTAAAQFVYNTALANGLSVQMFNGTSWTGYVHFSQSGALYLGSVLDVAMSRNAAGVIEINNGVAGTLRDLKLRSLGLWSATPPAAQPTVTGSRGGNAALASLLTQLASYGLIIDGTTA